MTEDGKFKVIGGSGNFWLWSEDDGFDLTHPHTPTSPPVYPRITLATTRSPAVIDPRKTALVVVDMQNYWLSPLLGRPSKSPGLKVTDILLKKVIPTCRMANIPILWLGWGFKDEELDEVPPSIARGWGYGLDENFEGGKSRYLGLLGDDLGKLKLEDGTEIEGGRIMMQGAWNTALYPPLVEAAEPQDMWGYKGRLSGFWGGDAGSQDVLKLLRGRGIRTLLFAGENTDQCVAASMQDAYTKGWDTLMLSDACGTNSPEFATKCIEFECDLGWGFVLTCQQLADGVGNIQNKVTS